MGVGGQLHAPVALPPGKENQYSLRRRLGGPKGRFGRVRKDLLPSGFDPRTDQPVTVSKFIIEGKKERRLSRQSLICIQKERDSILHVDPEVCCGWLLYFHVAAAYFRALICPFRIAADNCERIYERKGCKNRVLTRNKM